MRWLALLLAFPVGCFLPSGSPENPPIAAGNGPSPAEQKTDLQSKGVADGPPPAPTLRTAAVPAGHKVEVVDLTVDQRDPASGRQLAPYLLKSEEWTIVKVVNITPTVKHWRFQRVVTAENERLNQLDPLQPKPR